MNAPPRVPLPTLEELEAMPDDPDLDAIDWTACPHVQRDPAFHGGVLAVREHPRLPVEALIYNYLDGETIETVAYMFEVTWNWCGRSFNTIWSVSMNDTIRLTFPELTVITTARDLDLPEGVLPAGSVGTIVMAYTPDVYGIEFHAPWHVVTVRREDIILSDDDELCRLAAEEFANGTYEQREQMIQQMEQLHLDIHAGLVAEHGEEMVDLLSKLPEVMYDDMGPEGQRIVDGGMTVAGQFPRGLSKADLTARIIQRFIAR
jgi:hypothetical protein